MTWQVTLRSNEFYYQERGDSPEEALKNLKTAMEGGIAAAAEAVAVQQRRLDAISEHLSSLGTS